MKLRKYVKVIKNLGEGNKYIYSGDTSHIPIGSIGIQSSESSREGVIYVDFAELGFFSWQLGLNEYEYLNSKQGDKIAREQIIKQIVATDKVRQKREETAVKNEDFFKKVKIGMLITAKHENYMTVGQTGMVLERLPDNTNFDNSKVKLCTENGQFVNEYIKNVNLEDIKYKGGRKRLFEPAILTSKNSLSLVDQLEEMKKLKQIENVTFKDNKIYILTKDIKQKINDKTYNIGPYQMIFEKVQNKNWIMRIRHAKGGWLARTDSYIYSMFCSTWYHPKEHKIAPWSGLCVGSGDEIWNKSAVSDNVLQMLEVALLVLISTSEAGYEQPDGWIDALESGKTACSTILPFT